jgi:hypothetical protein
MIKLDKLDQVDGFVCDDRYIRLLDWCLWLRFLYYGFEGIKLDSKKFITPLNENNVSSRGVDDYKLKHQRIYEDFVNCLR